MFKIPSGSEVGKLMKFLWAGLRREEETLNQMVVFKEKCSLGIGNLVKNNNALHVKWLWRFPLEGVYGLLAPESIWGTCNCGDSNQL